MVREECMVEICIWPDGTWCEKGEEASYLQWMSDDYSIVEMTEDQYDEFLRCN